MTVDPPPPFRHGAQPRPDLSGLTDFRTVFNEQVEGAEVLDPHRIKFTFKAGEPTRDLPESVGGLMARPASLPNTSTRLARVDGSHRRDPKAKGVW